MEALTEPEAVDPPEKRIQQLIQRTEGFNVDNSIPIHRYWKSGRELLRMANVYLDEQDLGKAFILYMKYMILYIEQLPKHPEYNTADTKEKNSVRGNCGKVLALAEEIKNQLKARYQKEYEQYIVKKRIYDERLKSQNELLKKQRLVESQNERSKLDSNFVVNFQSQLDRKRKELASRRKDGENTSSIEDQLASLDDDEASEEESSVEDVPSEGLSELTMHEQAPSAPPMVDRSTKPAVLDTDFDKDQLSELIVPFKSITDKFAQIAQSNTSRNIETCAILAGKLSHNRFTITHLLVPKQSGTSDSCSATNEEEMALEQERLQLITMGWIHTHPSQKAFLSSIDLHTHAPYQKMLPEAIAIVVAPTAREIRIFSLTEHGVDYILRCRQSGFHPHPNELSLYHQAGHICINDSLQVQVVDFR